MTDQHRFTTEQLSAFIDGQLDEEAHDKIRAAMDRDPELASAVHALEQIDRLTSRAYRDIVVPSFSPRRGRRTWLAGVGRVAAMSAMLLIGGASGWFVRQQVAADDAPTLEQIAQIDPSRVDATRILLHIGTADPRRVEAALDAAQQILQRDRARGQHVRLEIVANAEGLSILRTGSPYARRIHDMVAEYDNISFKACGIAMETARLKEGIEVKLVPEAQQVNAALDQILTRLKQGWIYIRA
jgi:intracellular sulfur oxidation DsrE/DsrF family protein